MNFRIALLWIVVVAFPRAARADIYQWEYINPSNPALGKQQSATLCPDGAGLIVGPNADWGFEKKSHEGAFDRRKPVPIGRAPAQSH
jgi:hypothetical protein